MKTTQKKDRSAAYYNAVEVPETDVFCVICKNEISPDEETISIGDDICHLECFERKVKMEREEIMDAAPTELIVVRQLPVIEERLLSLKEKWEQMALDAEAMVCNEETIQIVKSFRSEMRKEFDALEEQRKQVKKEVMGPYEQFLSIYMDCVVAAFKAADAILAKKISDVETDMKRRCEDGLREYFDELCIVHHLDWLTYERANIKVDMASARAKTPKKLREQLVTFIVGVAESVERISSLENAGEIMVEYQRTLDTGTAICTVQERHRRIEEQNAAQEARNTAKAREAEMVHRVEALVPPVQVKEEKTIPRVSLVFHNVTIQQFEAMKPYLLELKKFADMEGIRYE